MAERRQRFGLVAWMAGNHVAANLLMLAMVLGGLLGFSDIRQEITPDFSLESISVSVAYPGASPEEVEEGIVLAIEKEITGMDGIRSITSSANEGSGNVSAELTNDADPNEVLQNIRSAVARITSFPDDAEPPRVERRTHGFYVISIAVASDLPADDLFALSERIRRQLLLMPGVSEINVRGVLSPQIDILVSNERLRSLDLTLSDIAAAVRGAARDVPAGSIDTADGEILLRTEGRRTRAQEFADIPVKVTADGTQLRLGDVATLRDGFVDRFRVFEFNGKPGLRLDVYQTENQRPVELADRVRALVDELNTELPDSVVVSVHNDRSQRYAERSEILLKNGILGLLLVVVALGIFLNTRLAFWVAVSIPVVFIGSFVVLPEIDVTLNMISMFAFILTLGIVVDDAIIVGENIYAKQQGGMPVAQAVREGATEMVVPVLYAVGTNLIAFLPLLFVPGTTGQFLRDLPVVASVVFLVSLFEALFILPSHLNAEPRHDAWHDFIARFRRTRRFHDGLVAGLDRLRDGPYLRVLRLAVRERYLTLLLFTGLMVLVAVWYTSGRIDLTWNPEIPGNRVDAEITMPVDASVKETLDVVRRVEAAALRAVERIGSRDKHVESWFTHAYAGDGDVNVNLVPDEQRPFTQEQFTRVWREEIGDLPEVKSLFFEYLVGPGGSGGLRLDLSHVSTEILETAARELGQRLDEFAGLVDISDGIAEGKRQIGFTLSPQGRAAGLTEASLGRQVRDAFYGAEALRLLRDGYELKVMVRLPPEQRLSVQDISSLVLRGRNGSEIALADAASFHEGHAYSSITREDGKRTLTVSASFDKRQANTRRIRATLESEVLPELVARYPGLAWKFSGGRRDRNEALNGILRGLLWASLAIFALTAALFRSYAQATIVMLTIPYSVAAAVAGHVLMGFDLSSVSVFGMIALGGLVVNGALVLTLRYNELAEQGIQHALFEASRGRFRPIVLTSLTTTVGLVPMLFETSTQALYLVPMAIALSFGTVASTFVVLLLIPALHEIWNDLLRLFGWHPPHGAPPADRGALPHKPD
ncbi:MAG: efflux RND transporter permease subunit [Gammaproteobacteria bacterium]|nr:efflux RND transporter permease subunit [Gammaproteobacteria bacterium]